MNSRPIPSQTSLQCDDFLDYELTRIRNAPENGPDEDGKHTELFWSLVVGLSKTKNMALIQAVDTVNDYLKRKAPELPLPATLDAGPERMQRLQKQLKEYQVDAAYQYSLASAGAADIWRVRKVLLIMEAITVGELVINHFSAVNDKDVNLLILFLFPMVSTLCLAGIVDPRVFWAVTRNGANMPVRFKVWGGVSALIGFLLSFYLAAFVYHVWN